jgi:predicted amidohydrolase YtcJ
MTASTTPAPSPRPRRLREAHAHLAQHGRAMGMEPLDSCTSLESLFERLRSAIERRPDADAGEWLLGHGLRVESWAEPRWPTSAELDDITPRPVCLWSFDHHALVVNSAALRLLGLGAHTADPDNGRIVRDDRGQPTGLMLEAAAKMVWNRIPEPSPAERRMNVRNALADLAAHGFTEVHDLLSQPWLGEVLAELHDADELPLQVLLYPLLPDLTSMLASSATWQRSGVRLAGAKLFADGTLNSRTAWMLSEYADPLPGMPCGQPMLSRAQLASAMEQLWPLGLGLAVHAIGDAAVRAVLDAADAAGLRRQKQSPLPLLRIEHAEIIDEADVPRFARSGIVASVQPCHLLTDIEVLRRALPHRTHRVLPLRELIDSGCTPGDLLFFGSDTPIVRPHPADSIQAAVHRRRDNMAESEALSPEQAITEGEAWAAFTPSGPASLSTSSRTSHTL